MTHQEEEEGMSVRGTILTEHEEEEEDAAGKHTATTMPDVNDDVEAAVQPTEPPPPPPPPVELRYGRKSPRVCALTQCAVRLAMSGGRGRGSGGRGGGGGGGGGHHHRHPRAAAHTMMMAAGQGDGDDVNNNVETSTHDWTDGADAMLYEWLVQSRAAAQAHQRRVTRSRITRRALVIPSLVIGVAGTAILTVQLSTGGGGGSSGNSSSNSGGGGENGWSWPHVLLAIGTGLNAVALALQGTATFLNLEKTAASHATAVREYLKVIVRLQRLLAVPWSQRPPCGNELNAISIELDRILDNVENVELVPATAPVAPAVPASSSATNHTSIRVAEEEDANRA